MKTTTLKQASVKVYKKPPGFEAELGEYGPQVFDAWSGQPIGWGFKIQAYLGEDRFNKLKEFGRTHCLTYGEWVLLTEILTLKEAIKEYGYPSKIYTGPRGGFRYIELGGTKFMVDHFDWKYEIRDDFNHFPDVEQEIVT